MLEYSPFDKAIHDLKPYDLAVLRNVPEGWYVEYKCQMVKATALAKEVSAFANMYGGWLFLGVQEQGGDNSVADEFPGIPKEEVEGALQSLRHSAADHLNPTPFFEPKVLWGPCTEIGLAEGNAIIAVEIPQSHTTPHVHKDGRIYRRVADGSEPKHETDRFVLDQLWRRAEPVREETRQWVECDPEFSSEEEQQPHVRMLLCVDPWRQRNPWLAAPLPEIRSILAGNEKGIAVRFDTVYTAADGLIARQVAGNDPRRYGLTWRVRRDLSCDIVLPLPLHAANSPDYLSSSLNGYAHITRFIAMLKKQGHPQPRIADLNFLLHLLIALVSQYRRLLKLAGTTGTKGEFFFKARVLNARQIVPFMDIETAMSVFEAHGLPMMMDRTVTVLPGDTPESFLPIREPEIEGKGDEEQAISTIQASNIFAQIARAFGIPIVSEDKIETYDTLIRYFDELSGAAKRAFAIQQNRNKRRAEG